MKTRNKRIIAQQVLIALAFSILHPFTVTDTYQGATSYTNAKEFYDSTSSYGKSYHAETINGTIYYATSAKLATSNSNLRYHTLGFDIELYGNGHSVSFAVQRGGASMVEIDSIKDATHEYILYAMNDSTLFHLANKANPTNAAYVLSAPVIYVKMNAILTTKTGTSLSGSITENGFGGLNETGTVYHLNNSSHLSTLKEIFNGHNFESYINISEELNNHLLQIQYNIDGTDASNTNCSSAATIGNGYSSNNGILYKNGNLFLSASRVLNSFTLLDPTAIDLSKPGYHLIKGQEWIYNNRYFSNNSYMPKNITPEVGYEDQTITMYANWEPNTYSVKYDANGGTGSVTSSDCSYDIRRRLRANTFTRIGYHLKPDEEWNTLPDGTGTSYQSKEYIKNLTTENNAQVTLYANWEPVVSAITLDKQGGNGGTDVCYEKYNVGFFTNADCTSKLNTAVLPTKTGYTFQGYFENPLGTGRQIINHLGALQITTSHYIKDATIYAYYTPNQYQITFHKQGGSLGSDSATATYNTYFPKASPPIREGYTFKGYYTKPNGQGTQYYNEHMACDKIYLFAENISLYAYWVDTTSPTIELKSDSDHWTNQKITLTATAIDTGQGLKNIQLYTLDDNNNMTLVSEQKNCSGSMEETLVYENSTEGVVRYKAVATDLAGNTAEAYHVVYYDVTAPKGDTIDAQTSGTFHSFQFHITDINIK